MRQFNTLLMPRHAREAWKVLIIMFMLPLTANGQSRRVLLETTQGNITLTLFDDTPVHTENFVKLVEKHFYDSLLFHRVIPNFMIQSGDPESRHAEPGSELGNGDLGYTLKPEFFADEQLAPEASATSGVSVTPAPPTLTVPPALVTEPAAGRPLRHYHRRGALAMAREGDKVNPGRRSSGCQFYIVWGKTFSSRALEATQERLDTMTNHQVVLTPEQIDVYRHIGGTPHLDGQYTVFGEVSDGLDVVNRIQHVFTDDYDRPVDDVRILRATLLTAGGTAPAGCCSVANP